VTRHVSRDRKVIREEIEGELPPPSDEARRCEVQRRVIHAGWVVACDYNQPSGAVLLPYQLPPFSIDNLQNAGRTYVGFLIIAGIVLLSASDRIAAKLYRTPKSWKA
jgi:hypothetical protein